MKELHEYFRESIKQDKELIEATEDWLNTEVGKRIPIEVKLVIARGIQSIRKYIEETEKIINN